MRVTLLGALVIAGVVIVVILLVRKAGDQGQSGTGDEKTPPIPRKP